jgi:hypothetical protein
VLAILIALVGGLATQAIYNQRVSNTRTIMAGIRLAMDQFATEDPLRLIYNRKDGASFGPYPPYNLHWQRPENGNEAEVWQVVEPNPPYSPSADEQKFWLAKRFARDLLNDVTKFNDRSLVRIDDRKETRRFDNGRSLYTYLRFFAPEMTAQVPTHAVKALSTTPGGEFVDAKASISNVMMGQRRTEVLGFHDAWGVPLDYYLYVKLDWAYRPDGSQGVTVVDRRPVLRARGISLEQFKAGFSDAKKWIVDTDLPGPRADVSWETGHLPWSKFSDARPGWVRVVPAGVSIAAGGGKVRFGYYPDPARDSDK